MIKLHPRKIIGTIGIMFFCGLILIAVNMTDNFRQTKDELAIFYTTSFDTCTLTKLERRKYPGRGDYSIFYSDCASNYFPVLLEKNSPTESYNLFKENVKLTKAANSVDIILTDENRVVHKLRIRNPADEDDRGFSTKVILVFMGICIVINIVLPDRLFEKEDE